MGVKVFKEHLIRNKCNVKTSIWVIDRDKIVQHLEEGTSVILDRYAYSGVAFSASKVILTSLNYLFYDIFLFD